MNIPYNLIIENGGGIMSDLITGLAIGGAFAGAIGGPAYVFVESLRNLMGSQKNRSMVKWAAGGAIAGSALLAGGGWAYENGLSRIFESQSPLQKAAEECLVNTPRDARISFTTDHAGNPLCTYTP